MAQLNFDATQVAPAEGRGDPIPAGWYIVLMDESDLVPTSKGGLMLKCRFSVLDGQYVGRKLFAQINLKNDNPVAQEIGFRELSAIAHAVNVLHVGNSEQLHGLPMKVKVKIRTDKTGEYEPQNEITTYKNVNDPSAVSAAGPSLGASPGQPGQPQAPQFMQPQAPQPAQPQPTGWAPQPQPAQQPNPQPGNWGGQPANAAPAQPTQSWQGAPGGPAPAQPAQPAQPWQQPTTQQPWQNAQPAQPQPVQQPVQQPTQQPQQPQQPTQQGGPAGFNPASAVPPWQQPGR